MGIHGYPCHPLRERVDFRSSVELMGPSSDQAGRYPHRIRVESASIPPDPRQIFVIRVRSASDPRRIHVGDDMNICELISINIHGYRMFMDFH